MASHSLRTSRFTTWSCALSVLLFLVVRLLPCCHCLVPPSQNTPKSSTTATSTTLSSATANTKKQYGITESFSIPLVMERPKPTTILGTFNRLWNDPRPVTSLISNAMVATDNDNTNTMSSSSSSIPYCIISDEFVIQQTHKFRVLLYPRGRYASDSSSSLAGPAAAYLRYIPNAYGDEVDIGWKLRLVDTRHATSLPIITSGGLPRSNTTWSAAMTFCSKREDLESLGRVADWGSSTWFSSNVCNALGYLQAEGDITVYASRTGESSFALPPNGAIKAVLQAATIGNNANNKNDKKENLEDENDKMERSFRVGEVIVPVDIFSNNDRNIKKQLQASFIYPGTDYRIMTMSDKDGNPIFSTDHVPPNERHQVQLVLRPCGWKLQQQLWQERGMTTEWPVQVPAGWLSSRALSRFNWATAIPRISSTFQRDKTAVLVGILLALAPLPGALIGRNFVSLYAIPSASMEPTLLKGDVLLVEKFPGVFDRTQRGDIILFSPPMALREIVGNSAISANSLFVKRIVGMPGDENIQLDYKTNEVLVDGQRATGPDRNLCDDEPLRLIDRLLEKGKGTKIEKLNQEEAYVLGDCKAVSVDSRVFGVLPKSNIEGKPIGRIWPLSRFKIGPL